MDYIKQNKKEQKIKQMTEKPIVVENADWTDEAEFIKKIIDALPQQQKIAFWMKHWEEYPNKVIEETLGVSAVNLRVILSRARKTIKDQFLQWKRI
jgi:RNA polymerase sigma-70 factor (ECF subfamily)